MSCDEPGCDVTFQGSRRVPSATCSSARLPGDEHLASGYDPAGNVPVGGLREEVVEVNVDEVADARLGRRFERPMRPLLSADAPDRGLDGRFASRRGRIAYGRVGQHPDIGFDARLPEHVHEFDVTGDDLFRLAVDVRKKVTVPTRPRWRAD